jgi:cyclopropane fatty-acyl-phospholipid synthase-like methyltransferase
MRDEYWTKFWQEHANTADSSDEQQQVLRTKNKNSITEELWAFTLSEINKTFEVNANDAVLDLCSGNGLFAKSFASKNAVVTAVDISDTLLNNISTTENIKTINSDIRDLSFENESFDKIFFYAALQYLDKVEAVEMFEKIHSWLKVGGSLYIGDIPDDLLKFNFYNNSERRKTYFDNIKEGKSIIGHWYSYDWINALSENSGFSSCNKIDQHEDMIYSDFRFDVLIQK